LIQLCSMFSTKNLVNEIKSIIIRNLQVLARWEGLHVDWKTALELKRVMNAF